MRTKRWVAAVGFALLLVGALALWWSRREPRPSAQPRSSVAAGSAGSVQRLAFPDEKPLPAWFTRPGQQTRRIAGVVTLDGKPAANATVTLQSALVLAGYGKPVETHTDAAGHFDLGAWPVAAYSIAASAPAAMLVIKDIELADPTLVSDALALRLQTCDARVSGVISDASYAPIVDAVVRRGGFVAARANAKGEYSVCVPFGDAELEYSGDGYGAVILTVVAFGSASQDVVLLPAASVSGHVVRADDGRPVADALVGMNAREWGRDRLANRSALSDASGAFRIDGLSPGAYRAWAFGAGFASEGGSDVQAQVGVVNDVTIKVFDRARVSGVVLRGDKPVPNVAVTPVRTSPSGRGRRAWTRADGTFLLDDVPLGDIVFSVEGYQVTAPALFHTTGPTLHEHVTINVNAMAAIRGIVTRERVPVEGAQVCCVQGRDTPNPAETTDASGHYEFTGLPPGTYALNAGSEQAGAFTLGRKVTVAAGQEVVADFELELAGEIAGTVVDADGKPVPGVFVRWLHEQTQDQGRGITDAQGHYRCRSLSGGGTYRAQVFAAAESPKPFPAAPGTTYPRREVKDGTSKVEGVTIAIDFHQMTIAGRVVDASGAPVVDAQVKALLAVAGGAEPHFNPWQKLPLTATDADGAFTLRGLMPGTYAVQATSVDGAESVVPDIVAGATGVTIKLTRPGSIEGTLAGFTKPPVIYATPWNGPNKLNPASVDGTTFRIPVIKPGRYLLNAQTMYEGDAKAVDVRAGEKTTVALTAKGTGSIIGSVLDFKTRKPLAGAVCRAVMAVDGQQGLTNWDMTTAPKSDEQGRVLIDRAPAGNVTVTCVMVQGRQSHPSADVVVSPGGRAEVTLLSAELTAENPGTSGIGFLWLLTPPRVWEVAPGSSAAKAGLLPNDLIVAVDGAAVDGLNGLGVQFLIDSHPIGSSASVTYLRGTTRKTVNVTITVSGD